MNFKEAHAKLQGMADGRYNSIRYEIVTPNYRTGEKLQQCELYIDGCAWHHGSTWDEAFKSLDDELNPKITDVIEIEDFEEFGDE